MLSRAQIEYTIRIIGENAQKLGLSLEETLAQQEHFRLQHEYQGLVSDLGIKETTMAAINFTGTTTLENLKKRYAKQINRVGQQNIKTQIILHCIAACKPCFRPINFYRHYSDVQAGKEILVIDDEDNLTIACKRQKNNHIIHFKCSEKLASALALYMAYIGNMHSSSFEHPQTETLLLLYKEIAAHQGYVPNKIVLDAIEHYATENLLTLCLWWCAANDNSAAMNRFSTVDNRRHAFMLALENSVRGNNRNRTIIKTKEDGTKEEIIDPKDNDDGEPNKPVCHWGLQNQLALCMQESHNAAHPDNVYIPDLADTIRAWLPNVAESYYANSPMQAQIKASQLALANAAAEHKTAELKYVRFFEQITKTIKIEGLKTFYEKYGQPTSKDDKKLVKELFTAMADNLFYIDFPEPITGNADDLCVEFKIKAEESDTEEESKGFAESRHASSTTNRSTSLLSLLNDQLTYQPPHYEIQRIGGYYDGIRSLIQNPTITDCNILRPAQPTILQFTRERVAMNALVDLRFTPAMLNNFVSNAPEDFNFSDIHVRILSYLVTGRRCSPTLNPYDQSHNALLDEMYPMSPIQHSQALAEIEYLNHEQIKALFELWHRGLTGDLLRSFWGPEAFNEHHHNLLKYLMCDSTPRITAAVAMDNIQGLTTEGAQTFLARARARVSPTT